MDKNCEYFPGHAPRSTAQRIKSDQAIGRRENLLYTECITAAPTDTQGDAIPNSRAYQLEMLRESLKRNTIVAMDTGSGKTHVAVLRIKKELEVATAQKLNWFLTPTVTLCLQQFNVLQSQISSVQIKSFTSKDNVDRWTETAEWNAALTNVNVVVSTYAILYNALCRGFISMESLALIIFDEAHNCIGRSPGSKIMQDFYWPRKQAELSVPHILGLTASPVIGSKINDLETLELLLDSTCKSPRLQKEELSLYVKRPSLKQIYYEGEKVGAEIFSRTVTMESLAAIRESLNIYDDPEIVRLRTKNTEASRNQMERLLKKNKTFIQDQLKSFSRRSDELYRALGSWAADFYISHVVSSYIRSNDSKDTNFYEWDDSEKEYLANALRCMKVAPQFISSLSDNSISYKVHALINFLHSCDEKIIGIIFVKERAVAYVLHRLLSEHPKTSYRLSFGNVVGKSQRPRGKRDIYELPDSGNILAKFRSGNINFLIATSVLEEGIDVPQCELVICFDEPTTLKSYIQCRGRARLVKSKWVVFVDKTSKSQGRQWEYLEREMKLHLEEERKVQRLTEIEVSEMTQCLSRQFRVQSTGALLNMDNAKGYLQCFCSHLSSHSSMGMRPEYIILEEECREARQSDQPLLSAKVILPNAIDSTLRVSKSKVSWHSEKNATKDAAFEAYIALYHAGLLNDHLQPLRFTESSKCLETWNPILEVHEQFNPWPKVARAWKNQEGLQLRSVSLNDQHGSTQCKADLLIPTTFPNMGPTIIYWDASTEWILEIGSPTNVQYSELVADHTTSLLLLAYGHRWEINEMKHVVMFKVGEIDINQMRCRSVPVMSQDCLNNSTGLLRDPQRHGYPYLFHSLLTTKPPVQSIQAPHKEYENFSRDQSFIALKKWSRRLDFLHPVSVDLGSDRQEYFSVLPQSLLRMDVVPMKFAQFGSLIPAILHRLEVQLVVKELCATVLADVAISESEYIQIAISTSEAREQSDYKKQAFLGNSVLKFLVSVFVVSKYSRWPEGYLSAKKDTIVSSSRLCRAGIDRGLDKFILTKVFTGSKWRPLYIDGLLEDQEYSTREISSKTIADVIESLIGAGWKIGDFSTSLSIIKAFLPEIDLPSIEVGKVRLFDLAPANVPLPSDLHYLEKLAGYSFKKKSILIQAMSHSSDSTATASYERLGFLGDAVLEIIIVTELFANEDKISPSLMHLYKTALVNGNYLSFIALEWNITQKKTDLKEHLNAGDIKVNSQFSLSLGRFMRHGSMEVGNQQREVESRHALHRHDILHAIRASSNYPWNLLAKIHANKFYSDLVESLLGAVWVDSGSLHACKRLLDRMGILPYLYRILQDRVHVLHPREELGILVGDRRVDYNVQFKNMDDGSTIWTCTVFVGDTPLYEATHGVSDDEVKTRAAEGAISLIKSTSKRLDSTSI